MTTAKSPHTHTLGGLNGIPPEDLTNAEAKVNDASSLDQHAS